MWTLTAPKSQWEWCSRPSERCHHSRYGRECAEAEVPQTTRLQATNGALGKWDILPRFQLQTHKQSWKPQQLQAQATYCFNYRKPHAPGSPLTHPPVFWCVPGETACCSGALGPTYTHSNLYSIWTQRHLFLAPLSFQIWFRSGVYSRQFMWLAPTLWI